METTITNFVKEYQPGKQARVELVNGRILDVVNGRYFDAGTSIILQGGKIEAMPGPNAWEIDSKPDFSIDLQGKTVLPALYNTHFHLMMSGATTMAGCPEASPEKFATGRLVGSQLWPPSVDFQSPLYSPLTSRASAPVLCSGLWTSISSRPSLPRISTL